MFETCCNLYFLFCLKWRHDSNIRNFFPKVTTKKADDTEFPTQLLDVGWEEILCLASLYVTYVSLQDYEKGDDCKARKYQNQNNFFDGSRCQWQLQGSGCQRPRHASRFSKLSWSFLSHRWLWRPKWITSSEETTSGTYRRKDSHL